MTVSEPGRISLCGYIPVIWHVAVAWAIAFADRWATVPDDSAAQWRQLGMVSCSDRNDNDPLPQAVKGTNAVGHTTGRNERMFERPDKALIEDGFAVLQ